MRGTEAKSLSACQSRAIFYSSAVNVRLQPPYRLPLAMHFIPTAIRGPLFMLVATGSYVVNDTMMKMATVGLPPYEVLFLRGVAAFLWGMPMLILLGYGRQMPMMFEPRVLTRNLLELGAILTYVVALANMPIGDAVALGQITPLLVLLGASMLFREKIGGLRMALIALGFAGALMVAQPTMQGISAYALLALANAVFSAARDIAGRRVAGHVPGMIVAISAVIVVLIGAGAAHLMSEEWVAPGPRHLTLLVGAGLFLIFGHFFIFMAYRIGPTGVVAPFYYSFTVWAVISGLIVFSELPNALALSGIALVVASGLTIVMLDERRRRLMVVA
jgi:drug/metabolite transporter (DMT)-like permease